MSNYSSSEFKEDPNTPWFKVFNLIADKSTVLDIGCSSGNFGVELIQKKACVVDGVEIDPEDVRLAKQKLRNVYTFNIEHEVPADLLHKYQVVYFGDVIEHLIDPVNALSNTRKLLAPGGVVVFSVPNMAHISVRMMLLEGGFEYGETGLLDKTHLHYYTRKEVERVFLEAGYTIQKLDWVKRDMPTEILDQKLDKLGLKANKEFYRRSSAVDAAAYQFIGMAVPDAKPRRIVRPETSPAINEMQNHMLRLRREHKAEVKRIQAHYQNLLQAEADKLSALEDRYHHRIRNSIKIPPRVKNAAKKIIGRN